MTQVPVQKVSKKGLAKITLKNMEYGKTLFVVIYTLYANKW